MKKSVRSVGSLGKSGSNVGKEVREISLKEVLDSKLISVVVNSVNKNRAKLLVLSKKEHEQLMQASKKNYGKNVQLFALFMDSNFSHQLIDSGHGGLTKEDFDKCLKAKYNDMPSYTKNWTPLKNVE